MSKIFRDLRDLCNGDVIHRRNGLISSVRRVRRELDAEGEIAIYHNGSGGGVFYSPNGVNRQNMPITTCPCCGKLYEEVSEEEANNPDRLCLNCYQKKNEKLNKEIKK